MVFALIVMCVGPVPRTADGLITEKSIIHDIGKLCFAFTAFWGYLTFGQYLVIWYGNMGGGDVLHAPAPHLSRGSGSRSRRSFSSSWSPFFGLLSRAAKVFRPTMALFAVCSLVGMWLMRYIEVYPSALRRGRSTLPFGIWEIGVLAALPRRVGLVLPQVHGRVPADARDADDVAVSRRGPGAGEPRDDGAAAGARVARALLARYSRATRGRGARRAAASAWRRFGAPTSLPPLKTMVVGMPRMSNCWATRWRAIGVELGDERGALTFARHLVDRRRHHLARPTPVRIEVDEHRHLGCRRWCGRRCRR